MKPPVFDALWGVCPPSPPELIATHVDWHVFKDECLCLVENSSSVPCAELDRDACQGAVWEHTEATALLDIPFDDFRYEKLCPQEESCAEDFACVSDKEVDPGKTMVGVFCVRPVYEGRSGEPCEPSCGGCALVADTGSGVELVVLLVALGLAFRRRRRH